MRGRRSGEAEEGIRAVETTGGVGGMNKKVSQFSPESGKLGGPVSQSVSSVQSLGNGSYKQLTLSMILRV